MTYLPDSVVLLAREQQGIITRGQAAAAGLTVDAIRARVDGGRWQRIYPGIFATFTGEPARLALLWAAVLKAGRDANLSHETAAELAGLGQRQERLIHNTLPAGRRAISTPGLVVHRSARILVARHPCQAPPRTRIEETVLDLAQAARSFDDALGWASAACGARLTTPQRVSEAMAQRAQNALPRAAAAGTRRHRHRGAHRT